MPGACPNCGDLLSADASRCRSCGYSTAAPPAVSDADRRARVAALAPSRLVQKMRAARLQGERKPVTALFVDVVGSTGLAEGMDPEDWATLINEAFDVMSQAVYRYEGTIAQLVGDGMLAFFGAPVAHEDDPERAVRAAVDMVRAIRAIADELRQFGVEFAIRVGINTGDVVVGTIGSDLRYEYTALGDAVNVAARLQTEAEPGTVLISEETYRRIGGAVEADDLGPRDLRGKTEPVHAYRVRAVTEVAGSTRGLPGLRSPMLGRDAELARLRRTLEEVRAGSGLVAVVLGEPGIGKSRLVSEFRGWAQAAAEPATWVEGHCLSYGQSLPYHLLLDLVRSLVGIPSGADPATAHDLLIKRLRDLFEGEAEESATYLAHLLDLPLEPGIAQRIERLDPASLQARYLASVRQLLETLSAEGPLVVACEDVHWADHSSVMALIELLPLVRRLPLLLVCASRDEPTSPAGHLLEEARRQVGDAVVELRLSALPEATSRELVDQLLDVDALPPDIHRLVVGRSEGNPLFVEELLRTLIDQRVLLPAEGGWTVAGSAAFSVPDNLQSLLHARIDRLPKDAKHALRVAAVIGRQFALPVLAEVLGRSGDADGVRPWLGDLERAGLIEATALDPAREYAFRHALVRDTAYESLLKQERRRLHLLVGETIERLHPDRRQELAGMLADHFEQAGEAGRALDHLLTAGRHALRRYANREALDFFARAERLAAQEEGADPSRRRVELLLGLGESQRRAQDLGRAKRTFEQAAQLADADGRPDRLAEAALGYGMASEVWGTDQLLVDLLERAIEACGPEPGPLRARLLARLAQALYFVGTRPRRRHLAAEAVEVARRSGDEAALAAVLLARRPLLGPDDLEERLASDAEIIEIAERIGDWELAAQGHGWRMIDVLETGDIAEVDRELELHAVLARQLGQPLHLRDVERWRAQREILRGDFAEAQRRLEEALRLGRQAGDPSAEVTFLSETFGLQVFILRHKPELTRYLDLVNDWSDEHPGWLTGLALLHVVAGRTDEAREVFERTASQGFTDYERNAIWFDVMCTLTEVAVTLGDQRRAGLLYDLLRPFADRIAVIERAIGCLGSVSRHLGLLAAVRGETDAAEAHFQAALAHHERLEAPWWIARTQLEYAHLLSSRGGPDDAPLAADLTRQATATLGSLGAPVIATLWPDDHVG